MEVPHLFTRVIMIYGEPLSVPRQLSESDLTQYAEELRRQLEALLPADADFDRLWQSAVR